MREMGVGVGRNGSGRWEIDGSGRCERWEWEVGQMGVGDGPDGSERLDRWEWERLE